MNRAAWRREQARFAALTVEERIREVLAAMDREQTQDPYITPRRPRRRRNRITERNAA